MCMLHFLVLYVYHHMFMTEILSLHHRVTTMTTRIALSQLEVLGLIED